MSDEYARVFCTAEKPPTIEGLRDSLKSEGITLELTLLPGIDLAFPDKTILYVSYEAGKPSFTAELIIPPALEFDSELVDFIEVIRDTKRASSGRKKVLQHFAATKFYIAIPLTPDLFENEARAIGGFLTFFVKNYGGMVQTDEEGFLEGKKTLLQIQWKS